jgi:hypothetical protein
MTRNLTPQGLVSMTRQIRLSVKSLTMVSTSLNKRKKAKEAKKKAAYR